MASFVVLCVCFFLLGAAQAAPTHQNPIQEPVKWTNEAHNDGDKAFDDLCQPVPAEIVTSANLTEDELSVIGSVCWNKVVAFDGDVQSNELRPGIPDGVECNRTTWCDGAGVCSEVCSRGTVVVSDWLKNAIEAQVSMARMLPLCYVQFLGTHNSAITLADGYGNRDLYFKKMLSLSSWGSTAELQTNNQWLSMTDQMNLGVRMLELDVHWVKSHLRIAHCGGVHSDILDEIIKVMNLISRLLGKPITMWDSETVGCSPSLSSIAADDQRLLADALAEIHAWLHKEENLDEFLIIYLDTQLDLLNWDKLSDMVAELLRVFPKDMMFTPKDRAEYAGVEWPTANQIVASGKRVLFATRQNFDKEFRPYFFQAREKGMCGWSQSDVVHSFVGDLFQDCKPAMDGTLIRVATCELVYGPLNCDVEPRRNKIPLNESTLPEIMRCGVNFPSPDQLTPERAAAAIWSWADGEPHTRVEGELNVCALMSADSGRWEARLCSRNEHPPISCRNATTGLTIGTKGVCPDGAVPSTPRHAKENEQLRQVLAESGYGKVALGGDVAGLRGLSTMPH